MSGFYSFVVWVDAGEVPIPEAFTVLEKGSNVFNVLIDDIEDFTTYLTSHGVRIIKQMKLDEHEQLTREDLAFHADVEFPLEKRLGYAENPSNGPTLLVTDSTIDSLSPEGETQTGSSGGD